MVIKKAQTSMEFLILMGFLTFVIIGNDYMTFFKENPTKSDEIFITLLTRKHDVSLKGRYIREL